MRQSGEAKLDLGQKAVNLVHLTATVVAMAVGAVGSYAGAKAADAARELKQDQRIDGVEVLIRAEMEGGHDREKRLQVLERGAAVNDSQHATIIRQLDAICDKLGVIER